MSTVAEMKSRIRAQINANIESAVQNYSLVDENAFKRLTAYIESLVVIDAAAPHMSTGFGGSIYLSMETVNEYLFNDYPYFSHDRKIATRTHLERYYKSHTWLSFRGLTTKGTWMFNYDLDLDG